MRLEEKYTKEIKDAMMSKFNYKSVMQIPKLVKVVVNMGVSDARENFRGINPNSFDGRGNYNLGIKEQLIFPEIEYDKIDKLRGMDITFVTTAETDEEAKELLTLMGAPFTK